MGTYENEIKLYKDGELVGRVYPFNDEYGTELNMIIEIDGETFNEPVSPFDYISEENLSPEEFENFVNENKEEIIKAINEEI